MATFFKRLAPDRDIMLRRQSVTPAESGVSKQKVEEVKAGGCQLAPIVVTVK
jgi:hypothetical protein